MYVFYHSPLVLYNFVVRDGILPIHDRCGTGHYVSNNVVDIRWCDVLEHMVPANSQVCKEGTK